MYSLSTLRPGRHRHRTQDSLLGIWLRSTQAGLSPARRRQLRLAHAKLRLHPRGDVLAAELGTDSVLAVCVLLPIVCSTGIPGVIIRGGEEIYDATDMNTRRTETTRGYPHDLSDEHIRTCLLERQKGHAACVQEIRDRINMCLTIENAACAAARAYFELNNSPEDLCAAADPNKTWPAREEENLKACDDNFKATTEGFCGVKLREGVSPEDVQIPQDVVPYNSDKTVVPNPMEESKQ